MPTDAPLSPIILPKIEPSINNKNQLPAKPLIPVMKLSVMAETGSIPLNAITMSAPIKDTMAICQFFQIRKITATTAQINPTIPTIIYSFLFYLYIFMNLY